MDIILHPARGELSQCALTQSNVKDFGNAFLRSTLGERNPKLVGFSFVDGKSFYWKGKGKKT